MRLSPSDLKVLLHGVKLVSPFQKHRKEESVSIPSEEEECCHQQGPCGADVAQMCKSQYSTASGPRLFFSAWVIEQRARAKSSLSICTDPLLPPWFTAPFQQRCALILTCLQGLRVDLRNYFYTSVHANNMRGVICMTPLPACHQTHQLPGIFAFFVP